MKERRKEKGRKKGIKRNKIKGRRKGKKGKK